MAPIDDNDTRHAPHRSCPTDENPFVAFRRLADEAVSSMLQNWVGLPSAFSAPDPHERWLSQEARRRTMESWGASTAPEEVESEGKSSESGAGRQSARAGEAQRAKDEYRGEDGLWPVLPAGFFSSPFGMLALPLFAEDEMSAYQMPMCRWLDLYTAGSPYSPLFLEQDPLMRRHNNYRTVWRRAFEDLLDAQYEKPLRSKEELLRLLRDDSEHATSWRARLNSRPEFCECGERSLRDQKEEVSSNSKWMQGAKEEESLTELDMYEQVLGKEFAKEKEVAGTAGQSNISKPTPQEQQTQASRDAPKANENANSQLGIVSTLTTTERTVMPDGSTSTKVVLKKRFADGREESSETVHNTKGQQQPLDQQKSLQDWANERRQNNSKESEEKRGTEKKGWFWS